MCVATWAYLKADGRISALGGLSMKIGACFLRAERNMEKTEPVLTLAQAGMVQSKPGIVV
ncbi:MAG: hypothetical protein CMN98_04385 [Synechococcus sp. NP17]|nr:hypothetical protein [Synechococcus sp. NP17]